IIKGLFSAPAPIRVVLNQIHVDPSPAPHGFPLLGLALNKTIDRRYMATAQTDDALAWIQQQSAKHVPWMCPVSYSSIHTPYQQPPTTLYPPGFVWPASVPEGNTTEAPDQTDE
ncbi:MAG: hypothetical protein WCJ07_14955, partial [Verrucomicrobiota bacterium]